MTLMHLPHPEPAGTDPTLEVIARWLLAQTSPNTATAYRADILGPTRTGTPWTAHCAHTGTHPLTPDRAAVDLWRHTLVADGCSPATVARRLASLSSLYAFAVDHGACTTNPAARAKRPRVADDSQALGLTTTQVRALLATAEAHSPQAHLLTALLATTGLRITEALSVDAGAVTLVRGHSTVTVPTKGGKNRTVVLTPTVRALLDDHLAGRTTGPVFLDRTGKRLTRKAAADLLARLGARTGITGLHPHALRHSAATNALEAGVDLQKVQDFLGHADPRTTRRYDKARNALDGNPSYRLADLYA